jgi:hypothetical protein
VRLPDPERSYVVLVGTGAYRSADLIDLPAVRNNLDGLAEVLIDPGLGGMPAARCVVLPDPTDVRTVYRTLRQYASLAEDTLLVYFAGHGRTGPRNELYLALADTDPDEIRVSAMPFDLIRDVLGDSPATNRVLILDCCFSGRAIPDMSGSDEAILGQVGITGTYTLAATPANAIALAPVGAAYTAFTGELLALVRTGVPDGPELLTFATIYRQLLHIMATRGLPRPGQRGTGTVDQLALTRNAAHPANPAPAPAASPPTPHPPVRVPGGHGVEFPVRSAAAIAGVVSGTMAGAFFAYLTFFFNRQDVLGLTTISGVLTVLLLGWSALTVLNLLKMRLIVLDREGITRHGWRRAHLPWRELSTIEIRRRGKKQLLICTPRPGSGLPANEQATKLWSNYHRGFVVANISDLRASREAVSVALTQYSGGRYRPETAASS